MSDNLIKVENVSKKFCRSLKRSLWYGVKDLGSELIGRNNSHKSLRKDEFWALQDISFELKRGDTLGLIGRNGAGKTTLLRMLNGLIKPDAGRIEIKGRMQALIALGAGFNPILTGRENVYVNASVLGIPKAEADRRFDEIVDFSGIEEFIDTPVQSYSSGMAVRLGFAVAVHMEPDILLVDEVLAVGDITFQNRCFNKIGELMSRGIAIVLVSHSMISIRRVCRRCLWLNSGKVMITGNVQGVCDAYQFEAVDEQQKTSSSNDEDQGLHIEEVSFRDQRGDEQSTFRPDEPIAIQVFVNPKEKIVNPNIEIKLKSLAGIEVLHLIEHIDAVFSPNSPKIIDFWMDHLPLTNDIIYVNVLLWSRNMTKLLARRSGNYSFRIISEKPLIGQLSVNHTLRVAKYVQDIPTHNS
ncbi:MAG: ATP-binding cassette domain-containing protein [Deltaproteobacteria bacterium]|nr:ATP-binding cassette domain-containing protein [Deltaproteobacteria bacterium]